MSEGPVEFTPQIAGQCARLVLFAEWRSLVAADYLTTEALCAIRGRLDGREFEPGPDRDHVALLVASRLAQHYGCELGDIDAQYEVPGTPDDFPPPLVT